MGKKGDVRGRKIDMSETKESIVMGKKGDGKIRGSKGRKAEHKSRVIKLRLGEEKEDGGKCVLRDRT